MKYLIASATILLFFTGCTHKEEKKVYTTRYIYEEPQPQTNTMNEVQVTEPKPIVNTIPAGPLSDTKVKEIQQALRNKGYDIAVDGVLGTKSLNALASFQQKSGLKANGQVDKFTLDALGVSMPYSRRVSRY